MPVMISEIVFKGEIVGSAPAAAEPSGKARDGRIDQRELIETCVDQVMRLLERREER